MLSRAAEAIYWMNRYLERAENMARFMDVNMLLQLDSPNQMGPEQWAPMVYITGDYHRFIERYGEVNERSVTQFMAFDKEYPNSIYSCLSHARENARSVREAIPAELWVHLNGLYHSVRDAALHPERIFNEPHNFFQHVKDGAAQFIGITMVTMAHEEVWHFTRLGRLIERADKTSRMLDVKYYLLLPSADHVGSVLDTIQWNALLRSASALQGYWRRYGAIQPDKVVEYLVLDQTFPRSMHFCLIRAEDSLQHISGDVPGGLGLNKAQQTCGRLRADLAYTNASDIIDEGLHEFLDSFQTRLNEVGAAINRTYFRMD